MALRLSEQRLEEIKNIVVDMYEKYDISCAPISGFEIATKMGIKVIPYSAYKLKHRYLLWKESNDGFLAEMKSGEYRIFYNDSIDYRRVNNTIMHEIGHVILEHSEDSELAEKEVKFFAKYALAPPVLIHRLKLKTAIEISEVFDISLEAAGYALDYYNKWLKFGKRNYTAYELKTIELFKNAI